MSPKYFTVVFMALTWIHGTDACGPGAMYGSRRRLPRKLTPLVLKESYPSTSEYSLSASGPFTTQLTFEHNRFRELVPNYNTDISFQDSEGSGEDHLMSRRCKEKLDTLAISTMNQYPGVRLRVLEAFDTENVHQPHSLHYEGRAVDISVSDRDRSKLGMLARLAIEAGFDYVNYRSKWHIHASVKTESTDISRSGGCFPANATVTTPTGPQKMSDLAIGDSVLVAKSDGTLAFSPVLLFLHRESNKQKRLYISLTTDKQEQIMLTASHLIYIADSPLTDISDSYVTFAKNVEVGHFVYVTTDTSTVELQQVVNITGVVHSEHYAPLTSEGSIIVNNVVASCYAMIESHELAHAAFRPMRMLLNSKEAAMHFLKTLHFTPFKSKDKTNEVDSGPGGGIHWYAELLYKLSYYVLPENYLYQ